MSNPSERGAEDSYERDNDRSPVTGTIMDASYTTTSNKQEPVPVQGDRQEVEDPIRPGYPNSDEQLEQDEKEALDQSNILGRDRLRHAKPGTDNRYNEGPDEDDLPSME